MLAPGFPQMTLQFGALPGKALARRLAVCRRTVSKADSGIEHIAGSIAG